MIKSNKPLRTLLFIGISLIILLLVGSLVRYESLGSSLLSWIDQLKKGK